MEHRPSRQAGITLIGFLILFLVFGFYILLVLKIGPIYLEYYKVKSSMSSIKQEAGIIDKAPREILAMIQKRWDVNDIRRITAENSVTVEKHPGSVKIVLDYEVEEPVIANVSAVVKFKEAFTIGESN